MGLDSYRTFADTDLLAEHMLALLLAGLSTRKYPAALEPVGDDTGDEHVEVGGVAPVRNGHQRAARRAAPALLARLPRMVPATSVRSSVRPGHCLERATSLDQLAAETGVAPVHPESPAAQWPVPP